MDSTLYLKPKYVDKLYERLLEDIQPYLGCTDISIIALGAALASQTALGFIPRCVNQKDEKRLFTPIEHDSVVSIDIEMNEGLYKASHATAIPKTKGYIGITNSASLGVLLNPEDKLNLFDNVNDQIIKNMVKISKNSTIKFKTVSKTGCNLYLRVKITINGQFGKISAESILQDSYTNVVLLKRNEETLFHSTSEPVQSGDPLSDINIQDLLEALEYLPENVLHKLENTIKLNKRAYEYGLKHAPGLGIGAKYRSMMNKGHISVDPANLAASMTAAGEDVRMGGENIPVMGVASSGSHGITSSIPIIAVAEQITKPRMNLLRSIALSFWITQKIKDRTGFLSAPCGCVISSGIGATAGITYYLGGNSDLIQNAINNFIISSAGVICDGGKTTCSIKLANAASTAVTSAFLAIEGLEITNVSGGIVRENFNQNIENLVTISKNMQSLDRVIVEILKMY